jgi:serine protease inhibitor
LTISYLFLFQDLKIKDKFLNQAEDYYSSSIKNVDFASPDEATATINQFVSDETNRLKTSNSNYQLVT